MKILSKNKFEQFDGFIYNGIKPVFMLKISNGKEIKCTNDHKFMMAGNILKELKDIKIDDEFSTGLFVSDIIDLEYQEDVYDALNVANGNVFLVNGIIASNCNLLYIDEVAFVQNWDEFSASVLPVISSGKTSKLIFTSTPKGLNHFYEYVEGARKGINDFKLIEVKWSDVPGRDEKWKEATLSTLNHNMERFEQEYCVTGDTEIETLDFNNNVVKIRIDELYKEFIENEKTS
jgi:intein/homing endonuclease